MTYIDLTTINRYDRLVPPPSMAEGAGGKRQHHRFACLDEDGIVRPGEVLQKNQMYLVLYCILLFVIHFDGEQLS